MVPYVVAVCISDATLSPIGRFHRRPENCCSREQSAVTVCLSSNGRGLLLASRLAAFQKRFLLPDPPSPAAAIALAAAFKAPSPISLSQASHRPPARYLPAHRLPDPSLPALFACSLSARSEDFLACLRVSRSRITWASRRFAASTSTCPLRNRSYWFRKALAVKPIATPSSLARSFSLASPCRCVSPHLRSPLLPCEATTTNQRLSHSSAPPQRLASY